MNTILSNAKAFLFDLNGTMINDMPYHIEAWHKQLVSLGSDISLEATKHQCYGKNDELLERVFPGKYTLQERIKIGNEKEAVYRTDFKPFLKLIEGLDDFLLIAAKQNIKMAIGSAAIDENIAFVIDNLNIRHYFEAIVSANKVVKSKPHPETFLKCAEHLGVHPNDCIVFEDTPKGVECALNAGMKAIVILGEHQQEEFELFENVIQCVSNYHEIKW
jgi:beta-phosphoglucomutase-like phosphatase (HAD superfamily)